MIGSQMPHLGTLLQATALIKLDQGEAEAARPLLEGGMALAQEMGEKGLAIRFVANLALCHIHLGDLARAIEYGTQATEGAKERQDAHSLQTVVRRSRSWSSQREI